jgi:hypothetical protein
MKIERYYFIRFDSIYLDPIFTGRPDGLALAFQTCEPGQSHYEAVVTAWLGQAHHYFGWKVQPLYLNSLPF